MWGFHDPKYHWFINNIIGKKFDCAIDKVYEIIKNIILPAFFITKSAAYSICGTMSSRTVCKAKCKTEDWIKWDWMYIRCDWTKIRWDWIYIRCDWIQIRWDWIYIRYDWIQARWDEYM